MPWPQAVIVVILLAGLVPIGLSASGLARIATNETAPSLTTSSVAKASTSPEANASPSTNSGTTPSPGASASPSPTSSPDSTGQATLPPTPRPTPVGTPAPPPPEPVSQAASASINPPPPLPGATPIPTPQPGLWRIEGYVVDENENPISNVCVRVGPPACGRYSLHTDDRGHYFLDVAQPLNGVTTMFDFYFEMPGRETVWWQFTPGGPIEFNVVLKKT